MNIGSVFALIGGWTVIVVPLSAWLGRVLQERAASKWRRDEQRIAETLRATLEQDRLQFEAAIRSHASGQDLFQQKRLESVQRLWNAVLDLRVSLSFPLFFFGILLPSEYDFQASKGGELSARLRDFTVEKLLIACGRTEDIEQHRIHCGETLWFCFFAYRAFLSRIAHFLIEGRDKRQITDWREDSVAKQWLQRILGDEALSELVGDKNHPISIYRVVNALEAVILREICLITSGKQSSVESFENAAKIRQAMSDVPAFGGLRRQATECSVCHYGRSSS